MILSHRPCWKTWCCNHVTLSCKILQKFYNEPKKAFKEEDMGIIKKAATCLKNDIKSCHTSRGQGLEYWSHLYNLVLGFKCITSLGGGFWRTNFALGFCCSYAEVQAYEMSTAVKDGVELCVLDRETLVQSVADNFNHNIRSTDGRSSFNRLGTIATITPRNTARASNLIPRQCNDSNEENLKAFKQQRRNYCVLQIWQLQGHWR